MFGLLRHRAHTFIACLYGATGTEVRYAKDHPSKYRQAQRIAENRNRSHKASNGNASSRRGGDETKTIARLRQERAEGLLI